MNRTGLAVLLALGLVPGPGRAADLDLDPGLQALVEAVLLARERHVDPARAAAPGPIGHAIAAYLRAFDDPATRYLSPEEWKALERSSRGRFEGLGVLIAERQRRFVVEQCFPGSPAARAGIEAGDTILELVRPPLRPASLDELRAALEASSRDGIVLALARSGRRLDVRVDRGAVRIPSVALEGLGDGVGLLRLKAFTEEGLGEIEELLGRARGFKALILDLRGNAGGVLDTAVEVAGLLRSARPVVWVVARDGSRRARTPSRRPLLDSPPAVVLIDRMTASAAEVLGGALARAGSLLVGEPSYGKASIQEVFPLADGGAAALTVARYELDDAPGRPFERLHPELRVEAGRAGAPDPVLAAAVDVVLGRRAGR